MHDLYTCSPPSSDRGVNIWQGSIRPKPQSCVSEMKDLCLYWVIGQCNSEHCSGIFSTNCCLVRSRRHTCFVDTTSDIDASMYCVQSKYTLILTHPHIHTFSTHTFNIIFTHTHIHTPAHFTHHTPTCTPCTPLTCSPNTLSHPHHPHTPSYSFEVHVSSNTYPTPAHTSTSNNHGPL